MEQKQSTINKVVNAMRGMSQEQKGNEVIVSKEQWEELCNFLEIVDHDFRMAGEMIVELSERLEEMNKLFRAD